MTRQPNKMYGHIDATYLYLYVTKYNDLQHLCHMLLPDMCQKQMSLANCRHVPYIFFAYMGGECAYM